MKLADGLSRFFSEKEFQIKPRFKDYSKEAIQVCNNILEVIKQQPLNLKRKRDISYNVRKEYKILFNESFYQNEKNRNRKRYDDLTKDHLLN